MKTVFISGPFTGSTPAEVKKHIRRSTDAAIEVAMLGAAPIALNPLGPSWHGEPPYEDWMRIALHLVSISDAVYAIEGHQLSSGCREELKHAKACKIPAFYTLTSLAMWIQMEE